MLRYMDNASMQPQQPAESQRPFSAPVVSKSGRSWGKRIPMVILGLLVLLLVVAAAYGGYYWEHMRAAKAEHDLQMNVTSLEQQLKDAKKSQASPLGGGVSACDAKLLVLSENSSSGAAGTLGITYAVTNKSASACTVGGYPTVTLIDSTGQQIGQPAQQNTAVTSADITLQANKAAYVTVLFPNAANYSPGYCSATKPTAIKILILGQTTALQMSLADQTYCPGLSTQALTATAP